MMSWEDIMVQLIDTPPITADVFDTNLLGLIRGSDSGRDVGIFAMFGGPIGATDGRYAYYLYPADLYAPGLHEYTLMPTHIRSMMSAAELQTAELVRDFGFTKDMPVLRIDALKDSRRIPNVDKRLFENRGTQLFDLSADPGQLSPIADPAVEARIRAGMVKVLEAHDAPHELFGRYGLTRG
jgi:hypothetical protein